MIGIRSNARRTFAEAEGFVFLEVVKIRRADVRADVQRPVGHRSIVFIIASNLAERVGGCYEPAEREGKNFFHLQNLGRNKPAIFFPAQ